MAKFDGKMRKAYLPLVSVADTSVAEGNGAPQNSAEFTVTLAQKASQPVTVWYTTIKGSGRNGAKPGVDFQAAPKNASVVIPKGETQAKILVPILGNTKYEPDKIFSVKLTKAQNVGIDPAYAQATGTITNDDKIPEISITDVGLDEGNKATTRFVVTVNLSNASYQTVKVKYKTDPATATAGTDYISKALATLAFAPGTTSKTVTILVKGDKTPEANETFLVNLCCPVNATIRDGEGVGTIQNDDLAALGNVAGVRDRALSQWAGSGELASCFDQLNRKKNHRAGDAVDLILAAMWI